MTVEKSAQTTIESDVNENILMSAMDIVDSHFHPRDLFKPHERMGWVSDYADCAMRRVFGDDPFPFDYHRFSIRFGDANEAVIRDLRELQSSRVPAYIAGAGVSDEEALRLWKSYAPKIQREDILIFSRVNTAKLAGAAKEFCADFIERRKKIKTLRLTQEDFDNFDRSFRRDNELSTDISMFCVDYAVDTNGCLNLVELRTTNHTDLPKAWTTVEQLLCGFVAAGNHRKKLSIGVVSNSQGIRPVDTKTYFAGEWAGHLGSRLHKDLILVEENLWQLVGPPGMTWQNYQNKILELFTQGFQWQAKTAEEKMAILDSENAARKAAKKVGRKSIDVAKLTTLIGQLTDNK